MGGGIFSARSLSISVTPSIFRLKDCERDLSSEENLSWVSFCNLLIGVGVIGGMVGSGRPFGVTNISDANISLSRTGGSGEIDFSLDPGVLGVLGLPC